MEEQITAYARVFGIPSEVVDLIGMDFIHELVDEMPSQLLPAFMSNLKRLLEKNGLDWIKRNVQHLKVYFLQLRLISESVEANESGTVKGLVNSAAERFHVAAEVLNLIDRNFISELLDEFPSLMLPTIMQTLRHEQLLHGLEWIKENVVSIREELLLLKRLYGPTWILV